MEKKVFVLTVDVYYVYVHVFLVGFCRKVNSMNVLYYMVKLGD